MEKKQLNNLIVLIFGAFVLLQLYWLFNSFISSYSSFDNLNFLLGNIPWLLTLIGLVVFVKSDYKNNNLLRIIMCYSIAMYPLSAINTFNYFTRYLYSALSSQSIVFYFSLIVTLAKFIISVIGLFELSKNKVAKLTIINNKPNDKEGIFTPVKHGKRFANWLVDWILITIIFWEYNFFLKYEKIVTDSDINFKAYLIAAAIVVIYYALFEGVFKTTAGKCATNTMVVSEDGEHPNFDQIGSRAFYRVIPFDAFSFLGAEARGWHDTLSKTYVVNCVNKEDQIIEIEKEEDPEHVLPMI